MALSFLGTGFAPLREPEELPRSRYCPPRHPMNSRLPRRFPSKPNPSPHPREAKFTPTAGPDAVHTLPFEDDFSQDNGWYTGQKGTWSISDGEMRYQRRGHGAAVVLNGLSLPPRSP